MRGPGGSMALVANSIYCPLVLCNTVSVDVDSKHLYIYVVHCLFAALNT